MRAGEEDGQPMVRLSQCGISRCAALVSAAQVTPPSMKDFQPTAQVKGFRNQKKRFKTFQLIETCAIPAQEQ